MRVHFTREAEESLERIGDHIAQVNPRRALTFVQELRAAALELGQFPNAYALVPRYERLGVRRRVYGSYLIFFRVTGDVISILNVVHGARNFWRRLGPKE